MASDFAGFGFRPPDSAAFNPDQFGQRSPPTGGSGGFDPSQFGGGGGIGGGTPGQFGGGAFGGGQANPMNESLYTDINNTISGVAAVEPILQASEGSNETISMMGRTLYSNVN